MSAKKLFLTMGSIIVVFLCCVALGGSIAISRLRQDPAARLVMDELPTIYAFSEKAKGEFPADQVIAYVDEGILIISLINSELDQAGGASNEQAKEVAIYSRENYPKMEAVTAIQINFLTQERDGLRRTSELEYSYRFTLAELDAAPDNSSSMNSPSAEIRYWDGLPVMPGAYGEEGVEGLMWSFIVDQNMDTIRQFYVDSMQAQGWAYRPGSNDRSLIFKKDEQQVSVELERVERSWEKTRVRLFIVP